MRFLLLLLVPLLLSGCDRPPAPVTSAEQERRAPRRPEMDAFFVKWLEDHGHNDTVVDEQGVGIAGNPTRLRSGLWASKHENEQFLVEVEYAIQLDGGREIVEFVAGLGDTEEQAIADTQLNFILTTFHAVYKGFMNADDPHMTVDMVNIGGTTREVIAGDVFLRGSNTDEKLDLTGIRKQIQGTLQNVTLTEGPHWIKVVYGQKAGKPLTVAVTVDNADHPELTAAVTNLTWPRSAEVYMAKQFLVVK